uniref:Saposin B-type domain-containing protein n=1 Tax=Parascaris univalens TaxID=6257 RepID=A0A915BTK4_PARUN
LVLLLNVENKEMKAITLFVAIVAQCMAIPLKISSPKACTECTDLIDEVIILNRKTVDRVADRKIDSVLRNICNKNIIYKLTCEVMKSTIADLRRNTMNALKAELRGENKLLSTLVIRNDLK